MVSYFCSPYVRNCAAGAANSNQSRDQFEDIVDLTFVFVGSKREKSRKFGDQSERKRYEGKDAIRNVGFSYRQTGYPEPEHTI